MLPEIEKLLVLQDRDRKIRALKQELKLAPLERKELDEKLAEALKKFEAVKLKAKEIEVERKKLENEVQAKRDSINKFQTQKFQTRKNEEFQALNNEIKRYEGDITAIEDRELELMESGEKAKISIAETERETQAIKVQVERQLADIAGKIEAGERAAQGDRSRTREAGRECGRGFAGHVQRTLLDQERSGRRAGARRLHGLPHDSHHADGGAGERQPRDRALRAVRPNPLPRRVKGSVKNDTRSTKLAAVTFTSHFA
ncbi:MAG: hypothetical protein WDN28_12355, partial [Chthoniobacter sp.]